MPKKSYLKLPFSFELDSQISNFKKYRPAPCPVFPILGTACPIGHEAALRPIPVYTDEINDSGGFLQLVRIYANKLRPLVGFRTIFLALF